MHKVTSDYEKRRAERLASDDWVCGVAKSFEEMEEQDFSYWLNVSPEIRFRAVFEVSREAWSLHASQTQQDHDEMPCGVRSLLGP